MDAQERTQDVYEQIAAYPKPPLVPLPGYDDEDAFENAGLKRGSLARGIVKAGMLMTGFKAFHRRLPENLEEYLRKTNLRGPALFAPVVSATLALKDDPRGMDPFTRAATFLFAARSFRDDIMSGKLPPDEYRDQVLEMGQYPNFFSTSTIVDGKSTRLFKSTNLSQITVVIGGRLYSWDMGTPGTETTIGDLAQALGKLAERAAPRRLRKDEPSPGVLTCAMDGTQRRGYRRMQKVKDNAESLSVLRHTFLTLCLDLDSFPGSEAEAARLAQSGNCENRWFQSSLQIVVFGNGKVCIVCSFSAYLDGNTMMRGGAELQRRAAQCPVGNGGGHSSRPLAPAVELKWVIRPEFSIRALRDLRSVLDTQQATFEIPNIGRSFFAAHGVEAVPAFILALQMASKHLTGKMLRITQFMSMSKYRCTELVTGVITTPEVATFVEYVESNNVQIDRARMLMLEAIQSQVQAVRRARRQLPLDQIVTLFMRSRTGLHHVFVMFILRLVLLLLRVLRKLRIFTPIGRQILVSHPEIYPEVPVVGRPGIRLPYVKHFGLHYQILEEKIVITVMPSQSWTIPNAELVAEIEKSLKLVQSIIRGDG